MQRSITSFFTLVLTNPFYYGLIFYYKKQGVALLYGSLHLIHKLFYIPSENVISKFIEELFVKCLLCATSLNA